MVILSVMLDVGWGLCVSSVGEDDAKINFVLNALDAEDPFKMESVIPKEVEEALAWQASKTPSEVMNEREAILSNLESAGEVMWRNGLCAAWIQGADPCVAKVSATVNGIMLTDMCRAIDYRDFECVELFRTGPFLLRIM